MPPTPEEVKGLTPEQVRAKYGEPVKTIELPNSLWMFYRDFHFQFERGKRWHAKRKQKRL
jgi:hypothetical protein